MGRAVAAANLATALCVASGIDCRETSLTGSSRPQPAAIRFRALATTLEAEQEPRIRAQRDAFDYLVAAYVLPPLDSIKAKAFY